MTNKTFYIKNPICNNIRSCRTFNCFFFSQYNETQQLQKKQFSKDHNSNGSNITILWIETLLQTPLSDHRKYCIWRILVPYLVNVRRLSSHEESYSVIKNWLDKCNKLERLNFDANIKIKEGLRGASKGYYPISLEKLRQENKSLYNLVTNRLGIDMKYKE
jgi:hypothetical protein